MLSKLFLGIQRLSRWRCVQNKGPEIDKAVLIFAPHTSNWDFWTMVCAKFIWSMKVRYLGKHTLFKPPHGWLFKSLGGIPVERSQARNLVDQVVDIINAESRCHLAIAPEGTRSYTDYWKTGFYHIANRANVPIIMFYLDTSTHTIGYSEPFYTTGDIEADFKVFAEFYKDKVGYKPEQTSLVQTKASYEAQQKD
jgi:1-acyl-sn-glycerol-3-phosphate acyltransferase